jgi:hypothetical protein
VTIPHFAGRKFPTPEDHEWVPLASDASLKLPHSREGEKPPRLVTPLLTGDFVARIRAILGSALSEGTAAMANFDARRLAWALTLGLTLLYLAFLRPGIYSIDGNSMLAVAESVVTRHDLTVPAGLGVGMIGRGGQLYSSWYPLQSILALPLVAAAFFVSRFSHAPFQVLATAFASVLAPIFTAITAGLVLLIALQLGSTAKGARRAGLCYGLGSVALVYTRTFYAEPLLALLVTSAIYMTFSNSRRNIFFAAALAGLAVLTKPTGVFLGPALSLYLLLKKIPFRLSVLPVLGGCAGLCVYAVYNVVRFGHPLTFSPPFAFALSNPKSRRNRAAAQYSVLAQQQQFVSGMRCMFMVSGAFSGSAPVIWTSWR